MNFAVCTCGCPSEYCQHPQWILPVNTEAPSSAISSPVTSCTLHSKPSLIPDAPMGFPCLCSVTGSQQGQIWAENHVQFKGTYLLILHHNFMLTFTGFNIFVFICILFKWKRNSCSLLWNCLLKILFESANLFTQFIEKNHSVKSLMFITAHQKSVLTVF